MRLERIFAIGIALPILFAASAPPVGAAANHVVISEFATRGPTSATEE